MKTLLPLIIFLFTFTVFGQTATVITKRANFRDLPNTEAKILHTLNKNEKIELAGSDHKRKWMVFR